MSLHSFGQITNSKLIGKWSVDKILTKPIAPEKVKPLIDSFEKAIFNFKENKDFELTTTNSSELFEMLISEGLINTKWNLAIDQQLIEIGSEKDEFSIMGIFVKMENEKVIFYLDETGLTFLMKKIN